MKPRHATVSVIAFAGASVGLRKWIVASAAGVFSLAQMQAIAAGDVNTATAPEMVAQGQGYQSDVTTGRTSMTEAQAAQYRTEYQTAKAQWAKMTPQQKSETIAAARTKKLSELTAIELVGQRDDMQRETAALGAKDRAEADAAKAKWDKLTPAEKQSFRKSAWQKRRAELIGMEAVGQRDDAYVVPW